MPTGNEALSAAEQMSLWLAFGSVVIGLVLFGISTWLTWRLDKAAADAAHLAETNAAETQARVAEMLGEIRGQSFALLEHSQSQFRLMLETYVRAPERDVSNSLNATSGGEALAEVVARLEQLEQDGQGTDTSNELEELKAIIRGVQRDLGEIRDNSKADRPFVHVRPGSLWARKAVLDAVRRGATDPYTIGNTSGIPTTVVAQEVDQLLTSGALAIDDEGRFRLTDLGVTLLGGRASWLRDGGPA